MQVRVAGFVVTEEGLTGGGGGGQERGVRVNYDECEATYRRVKRAVHWDPAKQENRGR